MSKTNCLEASTCVTCLQHTPENVACFSSFVALLRTNKQRIAVAHIQELFRAGAGPIEDENTKETLKKKQGNPISNLGGPHLDLTTSNFWCCSRVLCICYIDYMYVWYVTACNRRRRIQYTTLWNWCSAFREQWATLPSALITRGNPHEQTKDLSWLGFEPRMFSQCSWCMVMLDVFLYVLWIVMWEEYLYLEIESLYVN